MFFLGEKIDNLTQDVHELKLLLTNSLKKANPQSNNNNNFNFSDSESIYSHFFGSDTMFESPRSTGFICAWYGKIDAIPKGWILCDGKNGTPNLVDRFILGSNELTIGTFGGSKKHNHIVTTKDHKLTIEQMPSHKHTVTTLSNLENKTIGMNLVKILG